MAERRRAREDAVRAAQFRCLDGVPWPILAQALGISPDTLRRWRRELGDVKPLSATLGSLRSAPLPLVPAVPSDAAGGVLFLAGHAQDGIRFDHEAAAVRAAMWPASVPVYCAPAVALVEITRLIDEHAPRVLHVSAHADFAGMWLSDQGSPIAVSWAQVRHAIVRARTLPKLAVFNVCDSTDAAALVSAGVAAVVTCNRQIRDAAAYVFTQSFYASFARRSVRQSFDDACAALTTHHPTVDPIYELHPPSAAGTTSFS